MRYTMNPAAPVILRWHGLPGLPRVFPWGQTAVVQEVYKMYSWEFAGGPRGDNLLYPPMGCA